MKRLSVVACCVGCVFGSLSGAAETPAEKTARMAWWTESRFGMFIHFGLYSMPGRHEWVKMKEQIPEEKYETYFKNFNPKDFDATAWAKAAKDAGMRYAVLTAKHHEGFCLWDTKETDYKITRTPFGRDLVKEFVEAFRAEGLRVGLYYSLLDWHHPDYIIDASHPLHPKDPEWNDPKAYVELNKGRDMEKYRTYMKRQVTELLTQYGPIDIMWFDFSYPREDGLGKGRADWDSEGLLKMARSLAPNLIVDNRLDLIDTDWGWDFFTPEQFRPARWVTRNGQRVPWETCQTFSGSWGYHRDENTWKSPHQLIDLLIDTVSKGGNLIMNVGPTGRGEFDARAQERLQAFAKWMKANASSVYGCTEAPAEFVAPDMTRLTYNPKTNRLYVHLVSYPMGALRFSFSDKVAYAQFLHDGSEVRVREPVKRNAQNGDGDTSAYFELPILKPDVEIPVIEVLLK